MRIPEGRSAHRTGAAVNDVLIAGIRYRHNYVGSKPYPWTHWVLDMLGYQDDVDELHDLFAGSGAVTLATELHTPHAGFRCAACGNPIHQAGTGRPRRTCSDACRRRLARRGRPPRASVVAPKRPRRPRGCRGKCTPHCDGAAMATRIPAMTSSVTRRMYGGAFSTRRRMNRRRRTTLRARAQRRASARSSSRAARAARLVSNLITLIPTHVRRDRWSAHERVRSPLPSPERRPASRPQSLTRPSAGTFFSHPCGASRRYLRSVSACVGSAP